MAVKEAIVHQASHTFLEVAPDNCSAPLHPLKPFYDLIFDLCNSDTR